MAWGAEPWEHEDGSVQTVKGDPKMSQPGVQKRKPEAVPRERTLYASLLNFMEEASCGLNGSLPSHALLLCCLATRVSDTGQTPELRWPIRKTG